MIRNHIFNFYNIYQINKKIDERIDLKINNYLYQNNLINKLFYHENFNNEMNKKIDYKINTINRNYTQNLKLCFYNDKEVIKVIDNLFNDYKKLCENENKIQIKKFMEQIKNESYFIIKYNLKESELLNKLIQEIKNELSEKFKKKFYIYNFTILFFTTLNIFLFINLNILNIQSYISFIKF